MAVAFVGASAAAAHADVEPATGADPATPVATGAPASEAGAEGVEQVTLPKGRLLIDALVVMNLSKDGVFKPVSLSPDIWYGVSDKLTVGLVHSSQGDSGFIGEPGTALCLTGSSNGCPKFYNNVGLDVRYGLKTGKLALAFDGAFDFRSLSPNQMAIKVGLVGVYRQSQKLAFEFAPELFFGLNDRDAGNKDAFALPLAVLYAVAPKIELGLQTGIVLPLESTGDNYEIPLSVGVHYRVSTPLAVQLAFSFPDLVGGSPLAGGNLRTLTLGGSYAF